MLYDLGVIHSFISSNCVNRLKLLMSELPYGLFICTPASKHVKTTRVCMRCPFQIDDRIFITDLTCLPLSSLDLILGMDCLSANRVMLNCSDRSIVFPSTSTSKPMTSMCLYLNSLQIAKNQCNTLIIPYYA